MAWKASDEDNEYPEDMADVDALINQEQGAFGGDEEEGYGGACPPLPLRLTAAADANASLAALQSS